MAGRQRYIHCIIGEKAEPNKVYPLDVLVLRVAWWRGDRGLTTIVESIQLNWPCDSVSAGYKSG